MGRGERIGSKNNSKGQVRKRNVKSDDSDEDYMIEEDETADQSDDLESLVGDASDEESLGSFVVEEEEENVKKVVRQKSLERSNGRRKNGISISKKRKRVVSDEEVDEDYDYEEEEDNDADLQKSLKRSICRRKNETKSSKKRERVAYDEEDDEDYAYDYEEDYDANVQKSRKRSVGQSKSGMKSSQKRERIASDEEDDEEYNYKEEEEEVNDADADVDSIGGGGGSDDDDDYNDEDDHEEDGDAEFTLEELDFLDEEEEYPSSNGKKRQGYLQENGPMRSQKRKTCAKLLKKPRTNKRRGSSRSSKPTSDRSRKSMKKTLSSRGRCKTRSIDRKKKAKPCSDSDFVSSESSDFEFTVSEEEREQVREANYFCRRSSSNLRSSKQDQQDAAGNQLKKLPRRKGKEKVGEIKSNVGKQVCGICLTEEGKNTTRGTLDCCSHFFCFACIMEWSKVESRCPLCKQRFSTISKPARSAARIDLRNVVIHVPERDQVYQPSEEELRNYLDPYENVICTECHEGGEDALMLLCDICDSPAHTYCVGLGREVPEGNWYCEGCRPSALGLTSSQAQDLTPAHRLNSSSLDEPSFENMAEIDLNITIPETPMTPVNGHLVSPRQPSGGSLQAPPASSVGVSTLSGRRRVHRLQFQLMSSNRRTFFSGPWEDRAAQSSSLGISTGDVGTSYHAENVDRLQEILSSAAPYRESFPRRPSLLRGQALHAPPAADSSANGYVQSGVVGGINLERNCVTGHEWLQPCPSRLNLGSETSTSPWYNKDVDQNIAKQQVHSLVKSQLKNLCRDMDLGYGTFKQITVSSTHTILAACGLEHSRREVHEMRPPICLHYEALVGPQMSLIKGCCQACFDSFVRDVVRMVMDVTVKVPKQLSFRNY